MEIKQKFQTNESQFFTNTFDHYFEQKVTRIPYYYSESKIEKISFEFKSHKLVSYDFWLEI